VAAVPSGLSLTLLRIIIKIIIKNCGVDAVRAVVMKCVISWVVTPCSLEMSSLLSSWWCLVYFSTLKMEAICSSDTSVSLFLNYAPLQP
jgi:hypothetical protein